MITETESGLTAGQYTEIQVETEQMRYSVEAQRYAPSFSSHDSDSSMTGSCFDACIAGDWLVRAFAGEMSDLTVERLARENEGDETWEDVTVAATDINPDIDLSVVASGNAVRVFFVSEDDKVQYVECADISVGSPEFGVPVDVERVEDIIALAATGTTKLYYAVLTEDDNRHLYFTEYTSGAWSEYDSDIYYPFGIYGMDAVDIGDEDVVVMGAELPPIVGSRAVGTEVTTDVQRVQGIIVWRVASNRWSEHIAFDSDDLLERFPSRLHVRASYINSQIFMSYKRLGGFGDHTFNRLAVSRSVDGNDWEFPHLFNQSGPAVVLPTSDYLYMVGIDETTRSECCVWAGQTPASLDITDYVSSISSQAADIRATEVTLEDVGGALDDTLAKSEDWVQLVFGLGYYLPTDVSAQTMQVSIEDVVVTKDGRTLPIRTIAVSYTHLTLPTN